MSHLGDLLGAYLDAQLDETERLGVAAHLEDCEACRLELADVEWARSAVRGLAAIELPVLDGVRPRRRRALRPAWAWAVSAFAVGALAAGLLIGPGQADTAFDIGTLVDQHVARVVVDPGVSTIRGPVGAP